MQKLHSIDYLDEWLICLYLRLSSPIAITPSVLAFRTNIFRCKNIMLHLTRFIRTGRKIFVIYGDDQYERARVEREPYMDVKNEVFNTSSSSDIF